MLLILPGPSLFADGNGRAPRDSDSFQFRQEYQRHGAFQFFSDTEELLRTGNFELAYGRYRFLVQQTRGIAIYAALHEAARQRLGFLRAQMGLTGEDLPRLQPPRRKKGRPGQGARPSPAPPASAAGTESRPKTDEVVLPPSPEPKPPPGGEESKPVAGAEPPAEKVEPEAKASPPPPPSLWEKFRRRLKFW